ncbi:MAG TPA: ankyrin repeat domain-containing protein [Candidatus Akkermansia intestinigallinarum]|uniref:Ankyrin repeat domain-containing protein n=1 Tax=Candidatus Akkermansia intestinigallinarum TaxID=2838431 RepID=A0A9D2AGX6_9BACT|nr:ankyrin repeat domain-containing protein [Candidatus Akkermansia intestinigallinarum]
MKRSIQTLLVAGSALALLTSGQVALRAPLEESPSAAVGSIGADELRHPDKATLQRIGSVMAHGDVSDLEHLLNAGLDVNATDESGTSLLLAATLLNRDDMVRCLLEHGADIHQEKDPCVTPLIAAAITGNVNVMDVLLADPRSDINESAGNGFTPLIIASGTGAISSVQVLSALGADPDKCDADGTSPLQAAFESDAYTPEIVRCLLEHGADPNLANKRGLTPLHKAVGHGNATCVSLLLRHGARIDRADKAGMTPLMYAAARADEPIVRTLLDNRASVHRRDSSGRTPLIYALLAPVSSPSDIAAAESDAADGESNIVTPAEKKQVVLRLLEAGADPAIRDSDGRSAYDYAPTDELRQLFENRRPEKQ